MNGEDLESVFDNIGNDLGYDVEILFISHFNNIKYEHYLEQRMGALTHKFWRRYLEHGTENRGCDWMSVSLKAKCNGK